MPKKKHKWSSTREFQQLDAHTKKYDVFKKKNRKINLAEYSDNDACPVCGTVLVDVRNKTIYEYQKIQHAEGKNVWICALCTQRLTDLPNVAKPKKPTRPRGWAFMKEFVDNQGNVFYRGVEQIDLKGTKKPTVIELPKPKKRISKKDKQLLLNDAFLEINKIKKILTKNINLDTSKKLKKYEIKKYNQLLKKQERIVKKMS